MSELRQDLISGDWVLLAPGRAARPKFLDEKKKPRKTSPKSTCPFENLEKSGNWPVILSYPNEKDWRVVVIPNKYPAITEIPKSSAVLNDGIYSEQTAVGTHALLITRDHNKHFGELSAGDAVKVFEVLQTFHKKIAHDIAAAYVASFYNFGFLAGASIWHPHYQTITLPLIPPHVVQSLRGAKDYHKTTGRCARCDMITFELKKKIRIVARNKSVIAITPYASKKPFEVTILPKKHGPSFRDASPETISDVAALLQALINGMKKNLNDPDINFFIHDAPLDGKDYGFHHWHIELMPRVSVDAGFEFSTKIDINVVDPDNAAAMLRGETV